MKDIILYDDEYLMLRTLWIQTFRLPYPETATIEACRRLLGWDRRRAYFALRWLCRHPDYSPFLHCSTSRALREWLESYSVVHLLRSESDKRNKYIYRSFFSHLENIAARPKLPKLLIPIRPKYVEKILSGEKQVELRKRHYRKDISGILLYATAPCQAVVAEAELISIYEGPLKKIWQLTEKISGISREEYDKYFNGCKTAVAYFLKNVRKLDPPKSLADYKIFYTPQSCIYVR